MKKLLSLGIAILRLWYFILKLLPTRNKIVMISRRSDTPSLDFQLLSAQLSSRHKVVCLCRSLRGRVAADTGGKIRYSLHMLTQLYHLATSRVCIVDTYCPAVSLFRHKSSLTVIQIWQNNGPMEKFAYTAINRREGITRANTRRLRLHRQYTYVLISGELYLPQMARALRTPKAQFRIYTLPHFDLLHDDAYAADTRDRIRNVYPQLQDKPVVVYAPTRRGDLRNFQEHLEDLLACFDHERYHLVILPPENCPIGTDKALVDSTFTPFEWLFLTDKLITDYTHLVYEAGVLQIPVYFYAYDLNYYRFIRGLMLDYRALPGYTDNQAAQLVKDMEREYDLQQLTDFVQLYVENTENCTEKMVEFIETCM